MLKNDSLQPDEDQCSPQYKKRVENLQCTLWSRGLCLWNAEACWNQVSRRSGLVVKLRQRFMSLVSDHPGDESVTFLGTTMHACYINLPPFLRSFVFFVELEIDKTNCLGYKRAPSRAFCTFASTLVGSQLFFLWWTPLEHGQIIFLRFRHVRACENLSGDITSSGNIISSTENF